MVVSLLGCFYGFGNGGRVLGAFFLVCGWVFDIIGWWLYLGKIILLFLAFVVCVYFLLFVC
jgi:hypothetical protein